MEFFEVGGRRYARFERLGREPGLVHAFSMRPQDVSARQGPGAAQREAARRQVVVDLGLDPDRLHYCVQVHRPRIARIDTLGGPRRLEGFDGVYTGLPDVPLMTFSADCPLVLVYAPRRAGPRQAAPGGDDGGRAGVGLVHASWRCTVSEAVRRLVEDMCAALGRQPAELLAGIGPSAGPERYEVGQDVYGAAAGLAGRERFFPRVGGRMCFDLWEANRAQLLAAGVRAENVEVARVCTMTRTDLFFSYRREGAGCGHFALLAALRGSTD